MVQNKGEYDPPCAEVEAIAYVKSSFDFWPAILQDSRNLDALLAMLRERSCVLWMGCRLR